jgi:CheY-like chemotaxis protein
MVPGPKILIAEDDRMTRRILQSTFENHPELKPLGLVVVVANDGEEALERFHAERPDVVLADLFMPKLDGFALCRSIRESEHGRQVPIIVTSAIWKQPAIVDQLRRDFAVSFVTKPFQVNELVEAVRAALEQARGLRI